MPVIERKETPTHWLIKSTWYGTQRGGLRVETWVPWGVS